MEYRPYMKIKEAAAYTGLSVYYLRKGISEGTIPHIWSGNTAYINMEMLLSRLSKDSNSVQFNIAK